MGAAGKDVQQAPGNTATTSVRPTKLFIGGITRNTTTKQLRDHFERFGRVLDCVAMRTPDGRPRGFGYVTLDSPKAADSCLAMPQVIDGRIVDLKRAVPEADMYSAPSTRLHTPGSSNNTPNNGSPPMFPAPRFEVPLAGMPPGTWPNPLGADYGFGPLLGGAAINPVPPLLGHPGQFLPPTPSWPSAPLGFGSPDCVELLSACRNMFFPAGELPQTHMVSDLKADAVEFVPQPMPEETEEKKENKPKKRIVLGEIINTIGSAEAPVLSSKSPIKVSLPRDVYVDDTFSGKGLLLERISSPQIRADEFSSMIHTDDIFQDQPAAASQMQAGPGPVPSHDSETASLTSEEEDVFLNNQNGDMLPSLGSADHATGTCKRCNFFAKGRCQNGQDCSFCHLPHEKKKPTRAQKRERKAEWLAKSAAAQEQRAIGDFDTNVQQDLCSSAIAQCSSAPHFVAPPPGLSLPWQPEVEASPTVGVKPMFVEASTVSMHTSAQMATTRIR